MPDVNVLVYAHRSDEAVHAFYRKWIEGALNSDEPLGLSVLAAGGFLRIVTNARIYARPTPLETALATLDAISKHPNCVIVGNEPDHIDRLVALCRAANAKGRQIADAQHAAVAMGAGACFVTRDADFRRFEAHGLRWQHLVPPG